MKQSYSAIRNDHPSFTHRWRGRWWCFLQNKLHHHRTYDAKNRLKTLSFPDGRGNQQA
jgi:hypothetical protein